MDKKPWKEVIEWFADVSGLMYTGKEAPSGTFTFNPPKDKQYTIPEIVDLINDALLADKKALFHLVRRAQTFTLVPADEKIPPPVPLTSLEDLDKFGRTEIVRVEVRLKGGRSAEVVAAVRKQSSPWGSAMTRGGGSTLILVDTTAALREIIKTLRAADELAEGAAAKKPEDLAKDAAVRFAKAFDERSVDGMMGAAGLPFYYQPKGTPMGSNFAPSPVVKTEKELRAKFKEKVAGSLPRDIDRVVRYKNYRNKLLVGPDDLKALDEVAGNDAWVVFVTKKGETGVVPVVVKVEEGQARVVGLLGTWTEKDASAPGR
jgi:hypothetical protein